MDAFSAALVLFEIFSVVLGIALLYWWTNKEASEAEASIQNNLTEEDVMNIMVKEAKEALKKNMINKPTLVGGILKRETTLELQSIVVYHATRVGIARHSQFRRERRAFFADKNWAKYRSIIK